MEIDLFFAIFILVIIYVIILLTAKKLGLYRKKIHENCSNACPRCNAALNRIPRKKTDHIIQNFTFRIFEFRRYSCNNCEWQGLRWEKRFK